MDINDYLENENHLECWSALSEEGWKELRQSMIDQNKEECLEFWNTLSNEDKKHIAVHETGHCIIAMLIHPDDIVGVSVIKRNSFSGSYGFDYLDNKVATKRDAENLIAEMISGWAAELSNYGSENCSLASGMDLQRASIEIRKLITLYGFYGYKYLQQFGSDAGVKSSETILNEISELVESIFERLVDLSINLILANKPLFNFVSEELVSKRALSKSKLNNLFADYKAQYGVYTINDYYAGKPSAERIRSFSDKQNG